MQASFFIKFTNRVALLAAAALLYWVLAFVLVTVFDLRIFRERLTELFALSVVGLLAVLGGTLILNIMANLSSISTSLAARHSTTAPTDASTAMPSATPSPARPWLWLGLAVAAALLLALGLFAGDTLSQQRKQAQFLKLGQQLVADNQAALAELSSYSFTPPYVSKAERTLALLSRVDKNFPGISLLVPDQIDNKPVYLFFSGNTRSLDESKKPLDRLDYVAPTSRQERAYFDAVFAGTEQTPRFDTERHRYQFYLPVNVNGQRLLLLLSDTRSYGKFGS